MRSSRVTVGFGFLITWVVMAVVGWTARRLLLSFFDVAVISQYYMASFLGNGLLIGFLQWLVLWRYLGVRGLGGLATGIVWMGISGIGWVMAWAFNILFPTLYVLAAESGYSLFSISLLAGGGSALLVGLLQSGILKKYLGHSWPWVPIFMLSMVAAMFTLQSIPIQYPTVASALGGLVFGLISGLGMMMLLRATQEDFGLPEVHAAKAKHGSPDFR
ncbi:MAG: hypothetical protein N2C13_01990 [Chloroflexota bacterium]